MRRIRLIALGAAALVAVLLLAACDEEGFFDANRVEARESEQRDFEPATPVVLDVESSNGTVTVHGRAGIQTASVTVTKRSRGETLEQAQDRVRRLTYTAAQEGNRIELRYRSGEQESDVRRYSGVSFDVILPAETSVTVRTSNGAIEVAAVRGIVRLDTSNGSIDVRDCQGDVDAETSNGRVNIAGLVGDVSVDTSNGEIWLEEVDGRIEAETSNGSVHFTGRPVDGTRNRIRTSNGSITVRVPTDASMSFEASVSNGTIRTDLPLVGDTEGDDWTTDLNPPTTSQMELRTSNGNIRIEKLL